LTLERGPGFSVDPMSTKTVPVSVTDTVSVPVTARGLRVAEVAAAVGVSTDTIRFYEREGLLPPPERTPTGYRSYGAEAVERLRFIQGCQRLGLRLRDVADLLVIRDTGVCPCEPAEELLRRRIAEVDAELARLTALRAEMTAMADALPSSSCPPPTPGAWCPPSEKGDCDALRADPVMLLR
jgi:DNA-binding transcriptional MerR regulator